MKISASVADRPGVFSPFIFVGDLIEGMGRAQSIGYDTVELFVLNPRETGISKIADAVHSRNLSVSAIGPGLGSYRYGWTYSHPEEEIRKLAVERTKDGVLLAAEFKTSVNFGGMRGNLADDPDLRKKQRGWILDAIRSTAEFAGPLGVSLGVEPINRYETNFINTAADAMEVVSEIDLPNVGVLLDSFHMNIEEQSIPEAIAAVGDRLVNFHFVDSNRLAPGWGHTDMGSIVAALRSVGYDRYLSMEILRKPAPQEAATQALLHTRKLLGAAV
ncbi:MAG TPA: sugar phosphate isomerase/epimerase family protein [Chloroflexota bacterium]